MFALWMLVSFEERSSYDSCGVYTISNYVFFKDVLVLSDRTIVEYTSLSLFDNESLDVES